MPCPIRSGITTCRNTFTVHGKYLLLTLDPVKLKTTIQQAYIGTKISTVPLLKCQYSYIHVPRYYLTPDNDHYSRLALNTLRTPYLPTDHSKDIYKTILTTTIQTSPYIIVDKIIQYLHPRTPSHSLPDSIFFFIKNGCLKHAYSTTKPYKPSHLTAYESQQQTLKSFPIYVLPSGNQFFLYERNKCSTLTTTNNTTYTNHKTSHGYKLYSNQIFHL